LRSLQLDEQTEYQLSQLGAVLDRDNTASGVWADTAYRSMASRPIRCNSGPYSRFDLTRSECIVSGLDRQLAIVVTVSELLAGLPRELAHSSFVRAYRLMNPSNDAAIIVDPGDRIVP
jgi:hypothetical protein